MAVLLAAGGPLAEAAKAMAPRYAQELMQAAGSSIQTPLGLESSTAALPAGSADAMYEAEPKGEAEVKEEEAGDE